MNRGVTIQGVQWAFIQGGSDHVLRPGVENLWHPLTWMSQMVDFQCWGTHWGGHHATALLLHSLSVLLVWVWVSKLTKSHAAALITALLFAFHPLNAESVSWLSERKGLLSGFFSLLSLLSYTYSEGIRGQRRRLIRLLSVGFLLLALMSKPSSVVVPFLLVWSDIFFREGKPINFRHECRHQLHDKWVWFLPAAMVAGFTMMTQFGGTQGVGEDGVVGRMILMPANFFFYIIKMILPLDLAMHYPSPPFTGSLLVGGGLWGLFFIFSWGIWYLRFRFFPACFGWFWMVVCWLPVSGIVYVGGSFSADRYAYLMLLGPYIALGLAWSCWEKRQAALARVTAGLVLTVLVILTWKQVGVWKNTETLYRHAYAAQPDDAMVANNYATMLLKVGEVEESRQAYYRAAAQFPKEALITFNLGVCETKSKNWAAAIEAFRETLRRDPQYHEAWLNLGLILVKHPESAESVKEGEYCIEMACNLSHWQSAPSVLALIDHLIRVEKQDDAIEVIEKTMGLQSSNPHYNQMLRNYREQYQDLKK